MTGSGFPEGYVEQGGVFLPKGRPAEAPGGQGDSVAERIGGIISSVQDLSILSMELRRRIVDGPTAFHFSPQRANLLRPVSDLFTGRILEVGAGCGALTRFLGETGAEVFALEGSARCAAAARGRTRDLANVTVIADDVRRIRFAQKFDVITLVGGLETARLGGSGPDPIAQLLNDLRARLTPRGVLLVAIENQLGLRYFAGAKEDHAGRPFFGIEDLYADEGPATFGRAELRRRLEGAGFADCRWYYPFPDYRLPTTVLSEAAFGSGHDLSDLYASSSFNDPQGPSPAVFSLDQAWPVVGRNGLTEDLANSFLVACRASKAPASAAKRGRKALAWHYSTDRHPAFAKAAAFESGPDGLVVRRSRLTDAAPPDVPLRLILADETFVPGRLWSAELARLMNQPGWTAEQVGAWLRVWIDAVLEEAGLDPGADWRDASLPGRLIDATPFNLMRDEAGRTRFIDLEWEKDQPFSLRYLAYRALSKTLWRITGCAQPAKRRHVVAPWLIQDTFAHVGLKIDVPTMRSFEEEDRRIGSLSRLGALAYRRPSQLTLYGRILNVRSDDPLLRGLKALRGALTRRR